MPLTRLGSKGHGAKKKGKSDGHELHDLKEDSRGPPVPKGEGPIDSNSSSKRSSGGASVSPPDDTETQYVPTVDDEEARLEQGVKHWEEVVKKSHRTIHKEKEKIKIAERMIKKKKKAKGKSSSSHGHSTSSHEPQSPQETFRETEQPESPVFVGGDNLESEEVRRKPSASPPVDREQQSVLDLESEIERLQQTNKDLVMECDQTVAALEHEKTHFNHESAEHAALTRKVVHIPQNLATAESESTELEVILKQKEAELERLAAENKQKEESINAIRHQLQLKEQQHATVLEQVQTRTAQEINELREKLRDVESVGGVCVLPPTQHLQDIGELQERIKHLESDHQKEVMKLKTIIKEQEERSAEGEVHADKLSHQLEDTKKRLDECTKEIAELKRNRDAEIRTKVDRHDAVASGRLRELRNDVQKLTNEGKEKDSTIAELTDQLEKHKELADKAQGEMRRIEEMRSELEQMELRQGDEQKKLQAKSKEIESLKRKLHLASEELVSVKSDAEKNSKSTKESLDEESRKLMQALTQNKTLQSENDKLRNEYDSLYEQFEQLRVEANMNKELAEVSHCVDTCESPVEEPQDHRGASGDDDDSFKSASESSINGQDNAFRELQLYQRTAKAEEKAEKESGEVHKWKEQVKDLQSRMGILSQQIGEFHEWRRLLTDDTEKREVADGETTEVPRTFDYTKHLQLRKKFGDLMERVIKTDERYTQMVEKLQERDEQIKELQEGTVSLPRVYESLSSSENAEMPEKIDLEAALKEIAKLKKALLEKDHHVASLETQVSSFESTISERNKMERHGREQSKAVMEWRRKCEDAENELTTKEAELNAIKHEVTVQKKLRSKCEEQITALTTESNRLKQTSKLQCQALQQEIDTLRNDLVESQTQYTRTKELYDSTSAQLEQFHRFQEKLKAFKENALVLRDAMKARTAEANVLMEEKESLQGMFEEIKDELERRKIQIETYEEDFARERRDRENAASKHDEEIAALSLNFQKVISELSGQLTVLEEQNIEMKLWEEENDSKLKSMGEERKTLKDSVEHLRQRVEDLTSENVEKKEALELMQVKKQSVEEAYSKLDDKFKDKEATLEKTMAHKTDLEKQLSTLEKEKADMIHCFQEVNTQLDSECVSLRQKMIDLQKETDTLSGECQAKTQQVKQYTKKMDTLRGELQEAKAMVYEYEGQLRYYQEQVRQLTEDEEQKAEMVKAQFEAELLNLNRDLDNLKKEKTLWQSTQNHQGRHEDFGSGDKASANIQGLTHDLESTKQTNQQLEMELNVLKRKYHDVTEKCEIQWKHIDTVNSFLQQHHLPVPTLELPQSHRIANQRSPQSHHPQVISTTPGGQSGQPQSSPFNQQRMPHSQPQFREVDAVATQPPLSVQERRMVSDSGSLTQSEPACDHQGHPIPVQVGSQENALMRSINTEIHKEYAGVGREVSSQPPLESLSRHAPFDPNLVCPMCRVPFRIGEIQKYRQHVKFCQGT